MSEYLFMLALAILFTICNLCVIVYCTLTCACFVACRLAVNFFFCMYSSSTAVQEVYKISWFFTGLSIGCTKNENNVAFLWQIMTVANEGFYAAYFLKEGNHFYAVQQTIRA